MIGEKKEKIVCFLKLVCGSKTEKDVQDGEAYWDGLKEGWGVSVGGGEDERGRETEREKREEREGRRRGKKGGRKIMSDTERSETVFPQYTEHM